MVQEMTKEAQCSPVASEQTCSADVCMSYVASNATYTTNLYSKMILERMESSPLDRQDCILQLLEKSVSRRMFSRSSRGGVLWTIRPGKQV